MSFLKWSVVVLQSHMFYIWNWLVAGFFARTVDLRKDSNLQDLSKKIHPIELYRSEYSIQTFQDVAQQYWFTVLSKVEFFK